MQPYNSPPRNRLRQPGWNLSQPSRQSRAITSAGRHPRQPPGSTHHERHCQQRTINRQNQPIFPLALPGLPAKMIINLSMKSHIRFTLRTLLVVVFISGALAVPSRAADKKAPPARSASEYPAFDTHPQEHVTVAIDPCTEPRDCDFFRLPYIRHSLIPVRVIITNNSDAPLALDEARMQFITASKDKFPAATLDDINRRLFSAEKAAGRRVPIVPIPIPGRRTPIDKKITQDDDDFGFKSTTVTAHSTLAGYLFYDVKDLDEPPLRDAEIYIKMIHTSGGKELFAFSIPFNKWLTAQKAAQAAPKPDSKATP